VEPSNLFKEHKPPLSTDAALAEASRCLYCYDAPCTRACPTHIDVPAFIKKIASGNLRGSARTILSSNVLGASCARVCPTEVLCEGACVMHDVQAKPIKIGQLQRYATDWAMAHVYTGDTLCRMHRAEEAWPYYKSGFEKGPNDKGLISLALQCMWDEKILKNHDAELREIAADHAGSWIAYLATDTLDNGDKNGGVDAQYRPRNYNEGPKKKAATATETGTETATEWIDDSDVAMTAAEPSGSESGSQAGKVEAKSPTPSAQATVSSQH